MPKQFKTILIANRSEIARRVIRSAHECGYQIAAICSPHDESALYIREADSYLKLHGNPPHESYLDIEQVLDAAKKMNADAIHPGYGFLSENAHFSESCTKVGLKFIGPTPEAIDLLGDKTKARALARKLGVPTPDGTTEALKNVQEAKAVSKKIGYPVLLKAAAGGGGKGMRIVEQEADIESSLERAKGEALTAFGDDRVYIEKYITKPRHIEFQILADEHGNAVYLGERECSIQRRHQKLVEEAPSPMMTDSLRKEMGEAALSLVREAKYSGAGTVEFLVDEKGKYYFLEVNTRLQVEHPITEFITGYDLVREQFHIAEGEKLSFKQKDIALRGHSIEVRIQAEDVWNDFLPSLGRISYVRHPGGAFVRNDSALYNGLDVSGYYDSLLSKLIVWDTTRDGAVNRMQRALEEMRVVGVATTIPFHRFVMSNETFIKADLSTAFVEQEFTSEQKELLYQDHVTRLAPAFLGAAEYSQIEQQRKLFIGKE
ncbi:MAG TPA: acetyl-CoA carboxylase biotin carboxylase subunit [Candidatus Kapabacteria bacterium]|nr:acetyl-CoA carboxylase biotin carboxylase subunit [Candidatus Kapabacteria bacterium]